MKWHGLICGPESVQGYLAGTKTQTRRVVKPQPTGNVVSYDASQGVWYSRSDGQNIDWLHRCPYGVPGDGLYVREAWGYERVEPIVVEGVAVASGGDP